MKDIDLGRSLDSDDKQVSVDPGIFRDNCLVLGTEGSGKTTLAAGAFESLVGSGMSIVAIDTTGDLSNAISHRAGLKLQRGIGRSATESTESVRLASIDLSMATEMFSAPTHGVSAELLAEENENLIVALLDLLGFRPRPFSPEFALLEGIVSTRQAGGHGTALKELPDLIRTPPLSRIGMFPLNDAIPKDRRDDLSAAVASLLETPSFAYSSADPGIDVSRLFNAGGAGRCTVLTFADRSPRIRNFLTAVLGSKLRTTLSDTGDQPLVVWIDEASDFLPHNGASVVSRQLLGALERWSKFNASFVLVAQQLSDLHEYVDDHCGTMIVGQMAVARARQDVVQALDLVNPPIDETKLEQEIKSLRTGQFILRSRRLDTLKHFELRQ